MMNSDLIRILPFLVGGLVLFLYAIGKLSNVMSTAFTDKAKDIISRYTSNLILAILIGTLITILLDSSSAVIILTIIFINAKSLSFKQAVGIIMGANIGTTFSSQIIALDVGQFSVIPLAIGLIMKTFFKNKRLKLTGRILFYFGLLFFGLYTMEESVMPLKNSSVFKFWITSIENNHVQGAMIGGLITLIIQSSSATVGLAIVLAKQELLQLSAGVAIMLGAELGTCSDTLLATIKGSRQAIKAGLFHLVFNLTTIIIGLILFDPFIKMILSINPRGDIDNQIANAHVLFNVLGVILFLPVVSIFTDFLNFVLPEKKKANTDSSRM